MNLLLSLAWGGIEGEAKNVVLKDFKRADILCFYKSDFIGQATGFDVLCKHSSLNFNYKGTRGNTKISSYVPCVACLLPNSILGNDEEQAGLIWDDEPKSHRTVIVLRNHIKVFGQHTSMLTRPLITGLRCPL